VTEGYQKDQLWERRRRICLEEKCKNMQERETDELTYRGCAWPGGEGKRHGKS